MTLCFSHDKNKYPISKNTLLDIGYEKNIERQTRVFRAIGLYNIILLMSKSDVQHGYMCGNKINWKINSHHQ